MLRLLCALPLLLTSPLLALAAPEAAEPTEETYSDDTEAPTSEEDTAEPPEDKPKQTLDTSFLTRVPTGTNCYPSSRPQRPKVEPKRTYKIQRDHRLIKVVERTPGVNISNGFPALGGRALEVVQDGVYIASDPGPRITTGRQPMARGSMHYR